MASATYALVDWGTTNLRLWLTDDAGHVVVEHASADGMGTLAPDQFAPVLEQILNDLGAPQSLPVIICGMAGSRQGWREAAYAACPVALNELAAHSVVFQSQRRLIRILPGIARKDISRPDVMRGEETQLLGLSVAKNMTSGLVCLPGTHSKWVKLQNGAVVDFVSVMTGELYALLTQQSILRHSTGSDAKVSPNDPVFLEHVQIGLSPKGGLGRLFSIRAASLVNNSDAEQLSAALSGLLIGTEIRDACAILDQNCGAIHIIGSSKLGALYQAALSVAGFDPHIQDGDALVRAGLLSAAHRLQNMSIRAAE